MLISPAYAQTAGGAAAESGGLASLISFAPLLLIFIVFYFLMIRPQQKRMRTLQDSLKAVKKNDTVITAGGLIGKVTRVDETEVEIELAPNVKVRAIKSTLAEVRPHGAKPAND